MAHHALWVAQKGSLTLEGLTGHDRHSAERRAVYSFLGHGKELPQNVPCFA